MISFDFLSIPIEVRNKFYELIEGPIEADRAYYETIINEPATSFAKMVFLAWLYANGCITEWEVIRNDGKRAIYAEVNSNYSGYADFEDQDYDGVNHLGFGINIADSYYDYGLDTLSYLLKEI